MYMKNAIDEFNSINKVVITRFERRIIKSFNYEQDVDNY